MVAPTVLKVVSIVSIQADQSRRRIQMFNFFTTLTSFNRINSGRSIPTWSSQVSDCIWFTGFNRINSCRSIPTEQNKVEIMANIIVSIVSIHADQSRHCKTDMLNKWSSAVSIVSIHADQSRLHPNTNWDESWRYSFNRINSCRSIPTLIGVYYESLRSIIVSIVSIHADQSRLC